MCFVRKDFVAGWCVACRHVSAQMYLQKACFSTWVGYEQRTSGFHWDPSTERDTYNEGVIPSDSCPYAQPGQDPRYAFHGQLPLHFRRPLVDLPDEAWWGHQDKIPPQHRKRYKQKLPCIMCDIRYGELNSYWFCFILLTASANWGHGYNNLYRYFEGWHQSRSALTPQGHNLDANRPPVCWDKSKLRLKPHTFIPSADFLRGNYDRAYLDPRDVANRMGFRAQDAYREQLVLEGRSLSEGRCAGGTDDDDGFFDAYPLRNGAFNYLVEANQVYALVPKAEDMPLGPKQTDQHVGFMNAIDYDRPDGELEEIMDDNYRDAHRWDGGGWDWDSSGSAVYVPPQAEHHEPRNEDDYLDYDRAYYEDQEVGPFPEDDSIECMPSGHVVTPGLSQQFASLSEFYDTAGHLDQADYPLEPHDDEYSSDSRDDGSDEDDCDQYYDDGGPLDENYDDHYNPEDDTDQHNFLPDRSHWHM